MVRKADPAKGAHLVRGADEDRHVIGADRRHPAGAAVCDRLESLRPIQRGLFLAVPNGRSERTSFALLFSPLGPELSCPAAPLSCPPPDDARGGGEDMARRPPVVLFQPPTHVGARKILFEAQDVCPLPRHASRRSTGHHRPRRRCCLCPARQEPQPEILGANVGNPGIVDEDVAEPAAVPLQSRSVMGLEDRDHVQQEIAEIARRSTLSDAADIARKASG